jgi:hypothetical protein
VILYRKCTGWCTNDYNVHAYCQASKANPSACLACIIEHGAALSAAGCTPATENAFCKPAPPPGPGPSDVDQDPVSTSPAVSALYTGPVVDELQQAVTSDGKYSTTYRVFHSAGMEAHALHVVMDVGPLQPGRELITRFMSDIRNGDTAAGNGTAGPAVIWTDDNGLEFVRRKTNLAQEEAIASNCLGPAGAFKRP